MLQWIIRIFIFTILINFCSAQDTSRLRAGINIFGVFTRSLDIELQYAVNTDLFVTLSGGRQFNAKVQDLLHSENSEASGNFVRAGIMFLTSPPEKSARFFLKGEIIFCRLEHSTMVTYADFFEKFTKPYTDTVNKFGGAVGGGFLFRISEKFETDINLMVTYANRTEQYITFDYPLPGFAYPFFKPAFTFKYKF